jgi:hypothetical protein
LIGINYTQSELKEAMKGDLENLEKLLLIDKNTTSAAIRRRTSAHDFSTCFRSTVDKNNEENNKTDNYDRDCPYRN